MPSFGGKNSVSSHLNYFIFVISLIRSENLKNRSENSEGKKSPGRENNPKTHKNTQEVRLFYLFN